MNYKNDRVMRDWIFFIAVVEARSFTVAAKKLRCSIASVSKSISRLEDMLGVILLSRNAHKVEPTSAGYMTYDFAKEIRRAYHELFSELNEKDDKIKGMIRFSAPSLLCEYAASQWIFEYMRENQHAKLQLVSRDRTELTVATPEFDDLVLKSWVTNSPDVVHQNLGGMRFNLCASPGYIRKYGEVMHPCDLNNHWIMKVEHPFLQYPLSLTNDNQTYELHINNDTRLISNNVSSLLNMTLSGAGICLALPDWVASKFLKSGELERVLPEWQLPELPIYLVWRYRQNYSMLFNDFRKYIEVRWRDLLANGIQ